MTLEEMQTEQQDSKSSYLKWSLKIKQLQLSNEIDKFTLAKQDLIECKDEILLSVDKAQEILSEASSKVEALYEDKAAGIISEEMKT